MDEQSAGIVANPQVGTRKIKPDKFLLHGWRQTLINLMLDDQNVEIHDLKDILTQTFIAIGMNNTLTVEVVLLGSGIGKKAFDLAPSNTDAAMRRFPVVEMFSTLAKDG